jgi:tRNA(Ile)-lysidine synthase
VNKFLHSLESEFAQFIQSAGLVQEGDSILLAVSGGIDSTVMTRLLAALVPRWHLRLYIAHVNHQLRGEESTGDETFVQELAASLKIPFGVERVDTIGFMESARLSKQEAARQLRYEALETLRRRMGARSVATAHQADDNAETVLLNALRGTGIRGLAGIPLRREPGNIIRPMLSLKRSDIERYATERNISYRVDSSNQSDEYKRNYLRHRVIPELESSGQFDVVPSLNRMSRLMRQLDELLTAEVRVVLSGLFSQDEDGEAELDITKLLSKPEYLREGIILEVLRKLGAEVDSEKVMHILELCGLTTGSRLDLSKDLQVYRDRDKLKFVRPHPDSPMHQAVALGNSYAFEKFRFSLSLPLPRPPVMGWSPGVEFVDAGKLGQQLLIRSWQAGDWFMPLGMKARKKISDYFVDEKIALLEKKQIPIFESNGEVVWICGRRLDERFKVTDQTRSVIRLEFEIGRASCRERVFGFV